MLGTPNYYTLKFFMYTKKTTINYNSRIALDNNPTAA